MLNPWTLAIPRPVAQTVFVGYPKADQFVLAFRIISVRLQTVALNVWWIRIVKEPKLVSEIDAKTHVLDPVVRTLFAELWATARFARA